MGCICFVLDGRWGRTCQDVPGRVPGHVPEGVPGRVPRTGLLLYTIVSCTYHDMKYNLCAVTCGYDVCECYLVVGYTQWYDICECFSC